MIKLVWETFVRVTLYSELSIKQFDGLALITKASNWRIELYLHIWRSNVFRVRNTTTQQLTSSQLLLPSTIWDFNRASYYLQSTRLVFSLMYSVLWYYNQWPECKEKVFFVNVNLGQNLEKGFRHMLLSDACLRVWKKQEAADSHVDYSAFYFVSLC